MGASVIGQQSFCVFPVKESSADLCNAHPSRCRLTKQQELNSKKMNNRFPARIDITDTNRQLQHVTGISKHQTDRHQKSKWTRLNDDSKDQQVDQERAKRINEQQIAQGSTRFKDQERPTRSGAYQQLATKWTRINKNHQRSTKIHKKHAYQQWGRNMMNGQQQWIKHINQE